VRILTTGGTIASLPDPDTGAKRPALSGEELVASVPGLDKVAIVEVAEIVSVTSWNLTPGDMLAVARRASEALAEPDVDGVVVTPRDRHARGDRVPRRPHASLGSPGGRRRAMRSVDELSADGPRNLLNAVRVAAAPEARGVGAVVVMGDEIHAARWVRKLDSGLTSAFGSPRRGPIGRVTPGSLDLPWVPPRGFTADLPEALTHEVPIVSGYPGMDAAVIDAVVEAGDAAGLVVEGTGSGNVPGGAVPGIRRAVERGLPVVAATRVPGGAGRSGYGSPGGGAELRGLGRGRRRPAVRRQSPAPPDDPARQRDVRRRCRARVRGGGRNIPLIPQAAPFARH
jgi:L-asparaginase